jgi:hypothetical protein
MKPNRAIAAVLILFGVLFLLSPIEKWAVVGELGSPLFFAVGAIFLLAGIFALRTWSE